ncbi:coiled-coil domain-containing protein 83 [Dryobates pubescens]|uniref:coiled-coil domain-containing protein 83 n=1 Tax=Dryobates pubescens TaxID=118200 RepID=UPI0023B98416|nr:coiled-coil domain-containing protein 83 [Dryobates pubescens]
MEEKKKEETSEEQFTAFPEVLLEFLVETKEDAVDQLLFDLKQVEKKNKEYHEKNELLKKEWQTQLRRIITHLEDEEKELDEKEVVTRDDVEESLKTKCQYVKDKEQLLKDQQSQIEETQQRLLAKQKERDYWLEYKNVERKVQAIKIINLGKDIKEVKDDLNRAKEHYRNTLKAVQEEKDQLLEKHVETSNEQALENAVRYLHKNICGEIEENAWLKEEVKIYQKEVSDLKASVQLLEEENTRLVTKLIDSRLQNLRLPRRSFLTQATGLQDEFPKDEMKAVECKEYVAKADGEKSLRGATVPCPENKTFLETESKIESEKPQDSDEELQVKPFPPTLYSLLYEDEKDLQLHLNGHFLCNCTKIFFLLKEYVKLDPLETNLMFVVGKAMPIHKEPEEMPSIGERDDVAGKPDGHITAQMIRALCQRKG